MRHSSFFWHDYETWGANPRWDRPSQFAGIRTDTDLNIIGEPVSLFCQPAMDVLPHPIATMITGITPQYALENGLLEAEFFARVHAHLAEPGTCNLGYNSLRFDDEVTRFGLYRNFHDPYAREWQNGNGRWDIIDMTRLTRALRPEGINWPQREDGAPSFRLEELTQANGIAHETAHDAMSDVYATIDWARLIKQKQPRLFDYLLANKDKAAVSQMLDLHNKTLVLHVSGMFPANLGSLGIVMPLLQHPVNKNAVIVCNLREDPEFWLNLEADELYELLYTPSAELPEDMPRIPLKAIHINKCPVVVPVKTLTEAAAKQWQLDLDQAQAYRQQVLANAEIVERLNHVYSESPFEGVDDPDMALYDGFISDADKRLSEQVRQLSPEGLAEGGIHFEDRRLRELLFRYRGRNWPQSLNESEQELWQEYRLERIMDGGFGAGISLPEYQELLQYLPEQYPQKLDLINELKAWPEFLGADNV